MNKVIGKQKATETTIPVSAKELNISYVIQISPKDYGPKSISHRRILFRCK